MTDGPLDDRPAPRTATMAVLVAAGVTVALGFGAGRLVAALIGTLGAALLGAGAWALDEAPPRRQAGGSVAVVAGAVSLVAGYGLAFGRYRAVPFVLATLGLSLIAIDAWAGIDRDRDRTLSDAISSNAVVLLVGGAVLAVGALVATRALPPAVALWTAAVDRSTLLSLALLQALLVLLSALLSEAVAVLDRWVPDAGSEQASVLGSLDDVGVPITEIPVPYFVVLALTFVFAFVPWAARAFERYFGSTLGLVLRPGLLQHALAIAVVGLAGLILLGRCQQWLATGLGDTPASTLGAAAGGIVVVALLVPLEIAVRVGPLGRWLPPERWALVEMVGLAPFVLAGLAAILLAVAVTLAATLRVARRGFVPVPGSGFATGSALLAVAAGGGALLDLPAIVAFVGVAGALLSWDLGQHATGLGTLLGSQARQDRAEFVHVSASVLVLGGAVVLVTGVQYLLVPAVSVAGDPQQASRAVLGLALLTAAIVAFVLASYLRDDGASA